RKHASFFDWPDKRLKELGIVEELIEAVGAQGYVLADPHTHEPDPPDCVCSDAAGNLVALEVVELVSQDAVERNARGENVYRWWEPDDIRLAIESLLRRKDEKTFHGGPYADIAVVIHTDEPVLMADEVREAL